MTAWSKMTDRRITKLIRTTFETGALSAAIAFLEFVLYIRTGYVLYFMYAYYILHFQGLVRRSLTLLLSQSGVAIQVIQQRTHGVSQLTSRHI